MCKGESSLKGIPNHPSKIPLEKERFGSSTG